MFGMCTRNVLVEENDVLLVASIDVDGYCFISIVKLFIHYINGVYLQIKVQVV